MATHRFLAFDLGAESGRAVLGTLADRRLKLEEKHRFPSHQGRMNGRLNWNLLGQWESIKEGLRLGAAGQGPIDGIGVDTWGVDFGLLDADGQILANPVHYRDSRTDGIMEKAFARVSRKEIFQQTGTQLMQFNTLFQLLALQETQPHLLEISKRLLFMPDLFHYLFTGVPKSEYSIASTSQMYDPAAKRWATELVEKLGLPSRILPPVVNSGTVLGTMRQDVADECGVFPMTVIAPGAHDTASAVAAVPAQGHGPGSGWCFISSGSWSLMGVELPKPLINDKTLQYNYTNEGGVRGDIRFLKNIMGMMLVQECRRQFACEGHVHSYSELTEMARQARSTALIDPDYQPFMTPGQMPQKIEQFCKQTRQPAPATRGEFVRACLESLALCYRKTLEGLEDMLGQHLHTIHIVGGGTQNELLNQMAADATGRRVIAGPVEATAIGNILVQAMAVGAIASLDEGRQIVRESFDVRTYEPRDGKVWDAMYDRFRAIGQA